MDRDELLKDFLQRKECFRARQRALPFSEKIRIVEEMRKRSDFFRSFFCHCHPSDKGAQADGAAIRVDGGVVRSIR
jgi:hypothetical protein